MGEKKIKPYDDMNEKVKYVSVSYHDLERELSIVQATMATKEQLNQAMMATKEQLNQAMMATKEQLNQAMMATKEQINALDMKSSERANALDVKMHGMEERMMRKFTLILGVPITFFGLVFSGIQMLNFIKPTLAPYSYSNALQREEPIDTQRFTPRKVPPVMTSQTTAPDHKLQK